MSTQAVQQMWDYLYGHDTECPEYVPGKRLVESDECGCTFEWDSDTIEVVADMVTRALPDEYLRHRAQVYDTTVGAFGKVQVTGFAAGCLCGWNERGHKLHKTHGEALTAAMREHLDTIPIRLHV